MRRILQSKAGVGSLCAVAVLCIAGNFVQLPQRRPVIARSAGSLAAVSAPEVFTVPAPSRVAASLQSWRDLFPAEELRRDPFALGANIGADSPGPGVLAAPRFTLQAVSIAGEKSLVVLNHQILAPGERIGDYEVERIEPAKVILRGPSGQVVVPLFPRSGANPRDKRP